MLLHSLIHRVVQTRKLETENVPQRTMSNVYFLLSCYPNSFTDLDFFMLFDVICIYHTWYWPWFWCTAGWGRQMYITCFTGDWPWTKSALLRYASTLDIDRSLSWNAKQIIYYEECASSLGSWLRKMNSSINWRVGSPWVGRFPLYRSVQYSRLCVHTGCEL